VLYILVAVAYAYVWGGPNQSDQKFVMTCTYRPAHLTQQEAYPYKLKKFIVDPLSYCPSRRIIKDD